VRAGTDARPFRQIRSEQYHPMFCGSPWPHFSSAAARAHALAVASDGAGDTLDDDGGNGMSVRVCK
jgi:hypothetical protein